MLLIKHVSFDGELLQLEMVAPEGKSQTEMPHLVMRVAGNKLFGQWQQSGTPVGPLLKLVPARTASNPPQPQH